MLFPEFNHLGSSELFTILAILGLITIVINYFLNYLPVSFLKTSNLEANTSDLPSLSVIICAKNEEDNLTEFLPRVLEQDYPNFEVIVVNDCSNDSSENVIDEFAQIFKNLRKANIKEDAYYKHGKKFAMLVGIKAAKHNHLVFTDADCYPTSKYWLQQMASKFDSEHKLVLGYGAYEKQNGFLNKLLRFDTFMIGLMYLSAAIKKRPYMGVGRNLAYTKELFFEQKGFSSHYHINSGDDDLFVNQAANSRNTNFCVSGDAITYSKPSVSFKQWNIQKCRHLTTAPHYNSSTKLYLAFNYFSQYFFYLALIPLFFSVNTLLMIPIIFLVKGLIQILLLNKASKKMAENDLLILAPLYELILLFIYPIFHLSKFFYKPHKWTN